MPRIGKYTGKALPEIYFEWAEEIERLGYNYHEAMQAIVDHGAFGNALDWVKDHPMSGSFLHAIGVKKFIVYPRRENAGALIEEHKLIYEDMVHSPIGVKEFFKTIKGKKPKKPKMVNGLSDLGLDKEKKRLSAATSASKPQITRSESKLSVEQIDQWKVAGEGILMLQPSYRLPSASKQSKSFSENQSSPVPPPAQATTPAQPQMNSYQAELSNAIRKSAPSPPIRK
jgi:hypothetical protein